VLQRRALSAVARMNVKESKSGAEFPLAQRFWSVQVAVNTAVVAIAAAAATATQHDSQPTCPCRWPAVAVATALQLYFVPLLARLWFEPSSCSKMRTSPCCREGDNEYRCLGAGMRAKQILMLKAQVRGNRGTQQQQQGLQQEQEHGQAI
jgi:hypothetical protein